MTRKAYTISEVAAMLGRDRTTIWRWLERGALQYFTPPSGHRMISAASLARLVGEAIPEDAAPDTPPRRGRPPLTDRPWEAEGVSRRTWKRRHARVDEAGGPA
jgi:Helix-turn-helix domain